MSTLRTARDFGSVRRIQPLLHQAAEHHRVIGHTTLTEGEQVVLGVHIENVRKAIVTLLEFQETHSASNAQAVRELLSTDRFPASDEHE